MPLLVSFAVFFLVLFTWMAARSFRLERTERLYRRISGSARDDERVVVSKPVGVERLERALSRAGLIMPAYRFMGYIAVTCGGFFTLGLLLTYNFTVAAVMGLAGLGVVWIILKGQSDKHRDSFERQMESIIAVLSSSLRAGASLAQSVADLAGELEEPGATEFGVAAREIAMGVPAAETLQRLAARVRSDDMQMLATVAMVQSVSGGNLAEILDNLGGTVRDRKALRSALKAYTAEGRLSGVVIGLIPFVVVGLLLIINPAYFTPMLSNPVGRVVMIASFLMIIAGWFIIRQITQRLIY